MIQQRSRTTIKKVDGSGLTPTIIFSRLNGKRKFLFETGAMHVSDSRYSFIAVNPRKTYSGVNDTLTETINSNEQTYNYNGDLVKLLKQVMPRISNETSYPFTGGAVGYFRYNRNETSIPAANFHVYDTVILFDHMLQELILIHTNSEPEHSSNDPEAVLSRLLDEILREDLPHTTTSFDVGMLSEETTYAQFEQQVSLAKQAIEQQLVDEIVVARKLQASFKGDPFSFYRSFRLTSQSPYQYYIEFDDHVVIGSSNEHFVQIQNGYLTSSETSAHEFCIDSSIQLKNGLVTGLMDFSSHAIDVLAKVLPSPSVVGKPFDECYALLRTIEKDERTLYGGTVGYIGFNGQIDFAHSNEAIVIQNRKLQCEVSVTIDRNSDTKRLYATSTSHSIGGIK